MILLFFKSWLLDILMDCAISNGQLSPRAIICYELTYIYVLKIIYTQKLDEIGSGYDKIVTPLITVKFYIFSLH